MSLKALALLVLERNRARNSDATTPVPLCNSGGTAAHPKVAPSAEHAGALLDALEDVTTGWHTTARAAFESLTPEDREAWGRGEITAEQLGGFVAALETTDLRRKGARPPHYARPAECALCGPVWLWEGAPADVQACPWCANWAAGLDMPRPAPVACRDCAHYAPDEVNPPGGLGHCGTMGEPTWPGGDCPRYERHRGRNHG